MARFQEVEIERIEVSEANVRKKEIERGIEELAESIKKEGILQPLVVMPKEEKYELIIGLRRFEAAKRAGLQKVPVRIIERREIPEAKVLSMMENVQREDIAESDRAAATVALVEHFGSYETVTEMLGYKSDATIRRWTALHGVWPELKEMVDAGDIHDHEAIRLMRLLDREQAIQVAKEMKEVPGDARERMIRVAKTSPRLSADEIKKRASIPGERQVTIRFHQVIMEALEKAAAGRGLDPSSLAEDILTDWLREEGYLPG